MVLHSYNHLIHPVVVVSSMKCMKHIETENPPPLVDLFFWEQPLVFSRDGKSGIVKIMGSQFLKGFNPAMTQLW